VGRIALSVWAYPQNFAILPNLNYPQHSASKAWLDNQYRQDYEIPTEPD
jgi:hypothetical protein